MQRYFDFMNCPDETEHSVKTETVRKQRAIASWDDGHDIIDYYYPDRSDRYDDEEFAWVMTSGKDGIMRTPVYFVIPDEDDSDEDNWKEYPYSKKERRAMREKKRKSKS